LVNEAIIIKRIKIITIFFALLSTCFILSACQSEQAKIVDTKMLELCEKEITLEIGKEIYAIKELDQKLSTREHKSLVNYSKFEYVVSEYKALEDEAVEKIETMIEAIPPTDSIKLASEDVINDALEAYESTTEEVKNRVSNVKELYSAKTTMKNVKDACWVICSTCDARGSVPCKICGGSGSKKAYYTTPNGKTWLLPAECPSRETCGSCGGSGGKYVER
jgi:hypothetical protein